jgi:hypothetical protein
LPVPVAERSQVICDEAIELGAAPGEREPLALTLVSGEPLPERLQFRGIVVSGDHAELNIKIRTAHFSRKSRRKRPVP